MMIKYMLLTAGEAIYYYMLRHKLFDFQRDMYFIIIRADTSLISIMCISKFNIIVSQYDHHCANTEKVWF